MRLLLACGANPNVSDDRDVRPLHEAAVAGHAHCCSALLDAGAQPSPVKRGTWSTPLHRAIRNGHCSTVEVLLERGADPNSQSCGRDNTPMKMLLASDEPMTSLALKVLSARLTPERYEWGRVGNVWKDAHTESLRRNTSAWLPDLFWGGSSSTPVVPQPPPVAAPVAPADGKVTTQNTKSTSAAARKLLAAGRYRKMAMAAKIVTALGNSTPWMPGEGKRTRGVLHRCMLPDDFSDEVRLMVCSSAATLCACLFAFGDCLHPECTHPGTGASIIKFASCMHACMHACVHSGSEDPETLRILLSRWQCALPSAGIGINQRPHQHQLVPSCRHCHVAPLAPLKHRRCTTGCRRCVPSRQVPWSPMTSCGR